MSSYIGVYNKNDDLILWISTNSEFGRELREACNIPNASYFDGNEIKQSHDKFELSNKNYQLSSLIDNIRSKVCTEESRFLAIMLFTKDFDYEEYRQLRIHPLFF